MHAAVSGEKPNYVTDILTIKVSIPGQRNRCLSDTTVYDVRNFLEKSSVSRRLMSVEWTSDCITTYHRNIFVC